MGNILTRFFAPIGLRTGYISPAQRDEGQCDVL